MPEKILQNCLILVRKMICRSCNPLWLNRVTNLSDYFKFGKF